MDGTSFGPRRPLETGGISWERAYFDCLLYIPLQEEASEERSEAKRSEAKRSKRSERSEAKYYIVPTKTVLLLLGVLRERNLGTSKVLSNEL